MSRSVSKRSIPPTDTLSWGGTNTVGKNEYPIRNILKKAFWSVLDCKNKKPKIGTSYLGFRWFSLPSVANRYARIFTPTL